MTLLHGAARPIPGAAAAGGRGLVRAASAERDGTRVHRARQELAAAGPLGALRPVHQGRARGGAQRPSLPLRPSIIPLPHCLLIVYRCTVHMYWCAVIKQSGNTGPELHWCTSSKLFV